MALRARALASRPLLVASAVFGLFIVFDIALFGWLILDSLSQRELEEVLLETRREAEPIAADLAATAEAENSDDLHVVVRMDEETLTYIGSVLQERSLVQTIQIRDRRGNVVYQKSQSDSLPLDAGAGLRIDGDGQPEAPSLDNAAIETAIPIGGDLGTLVIGVSEVEVQRRIGELRGDLIRDASLIGVFTVALLVAGLVAFLRLLRRARELEEQNLEAERLAYVGTLASGLAHEIRSPLNSLSLNMQLLEEEAREKGGEASQVRLLDLTRSELSRLERLATDFLAYAKPRPMDMEEVPLISLLRRTLDVLGPEIRERGVEAEVEDRGGGVRVRVDPAQIGQLLLNLAQNALASFDGVPRRPLLRLVARLDEGDPVAEVIDNGAGIPDKVREKMFELFYSNRKGGTGLGLAIVQRIAEAHGARVEVDSVPGDGTTMRVRFPGGGLAEGRGGIEG